MSCCTCSRLLVCISDSFTLLLKLQGDILLVLNCFLLDGFAFIKLMKFLTVCISSIAFWLVYSKITFVLGWFLWCCYLVGHLLLSNLFLSSVPVLKPISLVVPCVLLVPSLSIVVPVEILSVLAIFIVARVSTVGPEI